MEERQESPTKTMRRDSGHESSTPLSPTPMTSVVIVCRSRPYINAISGIVWKIDAFLNPAPLWELMKACSARPAGVHRLLPRIAALEDPGMDPSEKRQRFRRALSHACSKADLPVVRWLVEEYLPTGRIVEQIEKLASVGGLHVLRWLHADHNSRVVWTKEALRCAARWGQLETLKWLHTRVLQADAEYKRTMLDQSAMHGNVKVAEWLYQLDPSQAMPHVGYVANSGRVEVVEWAMSRFGLELDDTVMRHAIIEGHTELAKWLHATASLSYVSAYALVGAAANQYFEVIEWALQHLTVVEDEELSPTVEDDEELSPNDDVDEGLSSIADAAAEKGHLAILKLLNEVSDDEWPETVMDAAAGGDHLGVVKWLHENRYEGYTTDAMNSAAGRGHLEVVQ